MLKFDKLSIVDKDVITYNIFFQEKVCRSFINKLKNDFKFYKLFECRQIVH